jgi:D-3-phosphoglycerate dehydrogenase
VTDFPDESLLGVKNLITIPHLASSTPESEDNCAAMASDQLRNYLDFGIIKNSVNYPDCDIPTTGHKRVCVLHKNIPNMLASITSVMAQKGINISDMMNKSKGDYAYTVIDLDGEPTGMESGITGIDGVIKVRVL